MANGSNKSSAKGGIKGYWNKRSTSNYSALRRPPPSTVLLGSATDDHLPPTTRRRFWRIPRRIRFLKKIGSPKRWLARLRDAYVNMMLRMANSTSLGYGYGYDYGCAGDAAFGQRSLKEYDQKILVEIYKNVLISQQPVASVQPAAAIAVRS